MAVDGLGVIAAPVEPLEVRICGRDWSDVLGAVQPACGVFFVLVEAHNDGAAAECLGQGVGVVPAVGAAAVVAAVGAGAS